jgi:hypothetical protein
MTGSPTVFRPPTQGQAGDILIFGHANLSIFLTASEAFRIRPPTDGKAAAQDVDGIPPIKPRSAR